MAAPPPTTAFSPRVQGGSSSASDAADAELEELLLEAERAHGHLCAGQILGVRMAMLAMRQLGIRQPRLRYLASGEPNPDRKRAVVFVEIDRCATDAIGVVTGARVGKRALKLRDWGKMAATFVDLGQPLADAGLYRGLRVTALESSKERAQQLFPGLPRNEQQMVAYRTLPDAELFAEEWVAVPLAASEFPGFKGERVTCEHCGEGVNFDRWVQQAGRRLCRSCAHPEERYYRSLP